MIDEPLKVQIQMCRTGTTTDTTRVYRDCMIRQRRAAVVANEKTTKQTGDDNESVHDVAVETEGKNNNSSCCPFWIFLLHLAAVATLLTGFYWNQTQLHTHIECDMTYSQRRFYEIRLSHETTANYKLYKFTDARDARHAHLWTSGEEEKDWCTCSTTTTNNMTVIPVLFIPGHAGDYQQARSLGAHALGLTGRYDYGNAVERIQKNFGDGRTTTIRMDVYAVDFNEEWTAWHGFYLERQSEFVEHAIHHLVSMCKCFSNNKILLVGHSLGGLIARSAYSERHVAAIVTMGTPHFRPIYAFDDGVLRFWKRHFQERRKAQEHPILISISGGLRDEIIPPESCETDSSSVSVLATDIMNPPIDETTIKPALLGMDHRAIVWCHNILAPVVHSLLIRLNDERLQLVHELQQKYGLHHFSKRVQEQHVMLQKEFGFWKSVVMETGFLYNAEWLVWVYTVIGAWYVYVGVNSMVPVTLCTVVCLTGELRQHWLTPPRPSLVTLFVLGLVASAIFRSLLYVICLKRWQLGTTASMQLFSTPNIIVCGVLGLLTAVFHSKWNVFLFVILDILLLLLHAVSSSNQEDAGFAPWMVPLMLVLFGGDAWVSLRENIIYGSPLPGLFSTLLATRTVLVARANDKTRCCRYQRLLSAGAILLFATAPFHSLSLPAHPIVVLLSGLMISDTVFIAVGGYLRECDTHHA